jgi:hypothetical protein
MERIMMKNHIIFGILILTIVGMGGFALYKTAMDTEKREKCKIACDPYVSVIIDKGCYCKGKDQAWRHPQ